MGERPLAIVILYLTLLSTRRGATQAQSGPSPLNAASISGDTNNPDLNDVSRVAPIIWGRTAQFLPPNV